MFSKKAVTNVEMIVAIVIFIMTIFTMLALFNVFHKAENLGNSADTFEQKFLEVSGNYALYEVYIDNQAYLNYTLSFEPYNICIPSACPASAVYSIPSHGRIFSYKQLVLMGQKYKNDYETLKIEFGTDFNLNIKDESDKSLISMTRTKAAGAEVYAKNFRIKIYKNNEVINAIVNVQTW